MMHFTIHNEHGEILRSGSSPEDMVMDQAAEGEYIVLAPSDDRIHYVVDGHIHTYTEQEQVLRANLPAGCIWKMPERKVVDPRTAKQKQDDAAAKVITARSKEYPPLTDLADAIYWKERGDPSKMTAYLNACDLVKAKYPKVG